MSVRFKAGTVECTRATATRYLHWADYGPRPGSAGGGLGKERPTRLNRTMPDGCCSGCFVRYLGYARHCPSAHRFGRERVHPGGTADRGGDCRDPRGGGPWRSPGPHRQSRVGGDRIDARHQLGRDDVCLELRPRRLRPVAGRSVQAGRGFGAVVHLAGCSRQRRCQERLRDERVADVSASVVTVGASTCNAATLDAVSGYFAEGHPVSVGVSGQRSFATDARGSLYVNVSGAIIAPGMGGASPIH